MRFVVQVASDARVITGDRVIGRISKGLMVLIGIEDADTREIADRMIKKLLGLRIFPDENDKTNLNLRQVGGELLLVSQFTLYADCRHGNRPSFTNAGKPEFAEELYKYIIDKCRENEIHTETGEFGAKMRLFFTNEGPFTIILDSEELFGM
ncbi:MAG: D-tyrosyl-tRNA(Tyr) deacylase [Lachnospiraceae bacterium]|nr:D-tyrosyl-tRNA(Tyr) deacylase [Lachnospiraceae bacterium]